MAIQQALLFKGASAPVLVYLTHGSSWIVPANWNNASNTIECIGAGGYSTTTGDAYGGGGAAYAKKNNLVLTPGASISYAVSQYYDTWFKTSGTVFAAAGTPTAGGSAAACIGDVVYRGGNPYTYFGGGAAGSHGAGGDATSTSSGSSDAGYGASGMPATAGFNAVGYDGVSGPAPLYCGSGGAKGGTGPYGAGGRGADYGGGGGGAPGGSSGSFGGAGLILITYTPL